MLGTVTQAPCLDLKLFSKITLVSLCFFMRPELPAPQCVVLQQICRAVLHDVQHADFKRTRRQIVDHHGSQKQRGSLPGHRDIPLHLPLPVTAELERHLHPGQVTIRILTEVHQRLYAKRESDSDAGRAAFGRKIVKKLTVFREIF